jgi:hypothetical protein
MNLHEEISKVAYELYEKGGRLYGSDLDNWLEAERIIRTRYPSEDKNGNEVISFSNMNYMVDEKRRRKRFAVKGSQWKFPYSSSSKIIDISPGGVAVEATKKLEVNKDYNLYIYHKGNVLGLKCRVVWSVLSREEKKESGEIIQIYKGGMKFQRSL